MSRVVALLCALLPAACTHHPGTVASPHYTLGPSYESGGTWRYPRESYDANLTGLATIYTGKHPPLTTDGEAFDQAALAAAHPTLQLPAIARLTDLETGRQIVVRINDRGPTTPHRLIAVTARTAKLLEFPASGVARVRLEVLPAESRAAVDSLPGAPSLPMSASPRASVQELPLAPLAGTSAAPPAWKAPEVPATVSAATAPPLRLPETMTLTIPAPGALWVRLGSFQSYRYAAIQHARLSVLHPEIVAAEQGGQQEFRVRLGPFATISQADAALDQAIGAGVTDAHIAVESGAGSTHEEFAQ